MTIEFSEVSANGRVPRSVTEVTSAGPAGQAPKKILVVAQRLSTGAVAADTPFRVTSETTGDSASGTGSQAAETCRGVKRVNKSAIIDCIGLDDDGAGVAAAGSIGITGTATESATLSVRIAGFLVSIAVASGDAAAAVLTALKAAIDAVTRQPLATGTIAAGAIPVTCRWKGPSGNDVKIETVSSVAGLTVALTQPTGGATSPSVTAAIAAVAAQKYDSIVLGLNDATSVAAWEAEQLRKWGAGVELDGEVLTGIYGDLTTATTWAASRNSRFVVPLATGPSNTPPWIWAAQTAGREAFAIESDGGAVVIDLSLPDCLAPAAADQFGPDDRETLLAAGLSTYYVGADGLPYIENLVTSYTTDTLAQPDETFAELRTMRIIDEYRTSWRTRTSKYRKYKLVDDGTPVGPGVKAVTPSMAKAEMDAFYEAYASTGNVEDVDNFRANSIAERNAGNRNRLDTFHPINVGNRVIVVASLLQIGL